MLVIGSVAMNAVGITTEINDIDVIGTYAELENFVKTMKPKSWYPISGGKKYRIVLNKPLFSSVGLENTYRMEYEVAWKNSTAAKLLKIIEENEDKFLHGSRLDFSRLGFSMFYPTIDVLYSLKMSHRYLKNSPHFAKTRDHIKKFRNKMKSNTIHPKLEKWFKEREKETYTYSHPKLNQTKTNFFSGDGVPYMYDHDSIHQAMATLIKMIEPDGFTTFFTTSAESYANIFGEGPKPAYHFYQKPKSEIMTSKSIFQSLPFHVRIRGVLEEAQVLALERAVIPHGTDKDKAFKIALEKVCTSITSGWFREFAWENYDDVMNLYYTEGQNYVNRFAHALERGEIKKYEEAA